MEIKKFFLKLVKGYFRNWPVVMLFGVIISLILMIGGGFLLPQSWYSYDKVGLQKADIFLLSIAGPFWLLIVAPWLVVELFRVRLPREFRPADLNGEQ